MAAANLYACIYGINGTTDRAAIKAILEKVHVPPFTPRSSVKIHVTDKEMEEDKKKGSDDAGEFDALVNCVTTSLPERAISSPSLCVCVSQKRPGLRS